MRHIQNRHNEQGFSLIELSSVVAIVALVVGATLYVGSDMVESTRRATTEKRLDAIETALAAYKSANGRLPCPASATLASTDPNYGVEAANPGTCTSGTPAATYVTAAAPTGVPSGAVPVVALGLPPQMMYDGWGRKFQYEVVPDLTLENTFNYSRPDDDCTAAGTVVNGITITNKDDTNTVRTITTGAVYALASFGSNGIGAYSESAEGAVPQAAAQITLPAAQSADEQVNVRSASKGTAPIYRNLNRVRSVSSDTTNYFDDIIRYKTRVQLMDEKEKTTPTQTIPEVILAYDDATVSPHWARFECGRLIEDTSFYSLTSSNFRFASFFDNNSKLLMYYNGACQVYGVSGGTLTGPTAFPATDLCPLSAASTNKAAALSRDSKTFVMSKNTAPYIDIWEWRDGNFYKLLAPLLTGTVTQEPENITISNDGRYITISRATATSYARLLVRMGNSYVSIYSQPYVLLAVSPDGTNLYASTSTALSTSGALFKRFANSAGIGNGFISGVTATVLAGMGSASGASLRSITFSPDGQYVVSTATAGTTRRFGVWRVNPAAENAIQTVTLSPTYSNTYQPISAAFSADSQYLIVATNNTAKPFIAYRRTTATTFTEVSSYGITFPAKVSAVVAFRR